jgi:uncharacterized MAPEG superfamily protein
MSLSLHKVPFVNWTYSGGDISSQSDISKRMTLASNNLRQSLPIFMVFSVLSIILEIDNLFLAQCWLSLRVVYLLGAVINLYQYKMIRPLIWLPSIILLLCMGCNLLG